MRSRPATSSTASTSRTVTLSVRHLLGICAPGNFRLLTFDTHSSISSAREDGQVKRGSRGSSGIISSAQEAARYRLTIRPACRQPAREEVGFFPVCRPVSVHPEVRAAGSENDPAQGQVADRPRVESPAAPPSRPLRRWIASQDASRRLTTLSTDLIAS